MIIKVLVRYLVAKVMTVVSVIHKVTFMSLDPMRQLSGLEGLQSLLADLGQVPDDGGLKVGEK